MKNNYAPVAVFTYNRPDHTRRVLDALNASALAAKTDLYIFCDNYKNESARDKVLEVRELVDSFARNSKFRAIDIRKAERNKGLASSIIDGVTEIMNKYGKAIVVEDDMLASIHFLEYMNEALDYYEENKSIWSISGYTFPMKALETYPHDIYMSGRGCCWGWGSWADRWKTVDWDMQDYKAYKHNWVKRYKFARWGKDMPIMLDTQMYMNHNSWAIRWCYAEYKQGMKTVYPKVSYIQNIGNDGTGVHASKLAEKFDTILENNESYLCKFEDLPYDEGIRREFVKKYFGTWIGWFRVQVKWMLIRIGALKPSK